MAATRGKNFSLHEDIQICKSWIATRGAVEAGVNRWEALYQHATSREKGLTSRNCMGLRGRYFGINKAVKRFAECLEERMNSVEEAILLYRSRFGEEFKFMHCWNVLRDIGSENSADCKDESTGEAESSQVFVEPEVCDPHDWPEDVKDFEFKCFEEPLDGSEQKDEDNVATVDEVVTKKEKKTVSSFRGKNFSQKEDMQICKSWIATMNVAGIRRWEALHQDALSKVKTIERRNPSGLRSRYFLIAKWAKKLMECLQKVQHQQVDDGQSFEQAKRLLRKKYKEDFKFEHCWEILKPHLNIDTDAKTDKDDTSDDEDESQKKSGKTDACTDEMKGSDCNKLDDDSTSNDEETFELKISSSRGRNFSPSEDIQICHSWVTTTDVIGFNRWEALYQDAISKEEVIKQRNVTGVRNRFLLIMRAVKNFINCLKQVQQEKPQEGNESEQFQEAMQLYATTHGEEFKLVQCWKVLKDSNLSTEVNTSGKKTDNDSLFGVDEKPKTSKPDTNTARRSINFRADEIQALLKASLELGMEDARRTDERYSYLFCDVQQRMATYGSFPERKLYYLKQYYLKTEKNYRSGQLIPYPPEARALWGSCEYDADDKTNDEAWEKLAEDARRKKSRSYMTETEIAELINLALARKIESFPEMKQRAMFEDISLDLHNKGLCVWKHAKQLFQDYKSLKSKFLSGTSTNLPAQASQLWVAQDDGDAEDTAMQFEDANSNHSFEFVEQKIKVEADGCRICLRELGEVTKDLFEDEYNGQSYGEIIQENINVQVIQGIGSTTKICAPCSLFIESLGEFVQRCRKSFHIASVNAEEKLTIGKTECSNFPESDTFHPNSHDSQTVGEIEKACEENLQDYDAMDDDYQDEPEEVMEDASHDATEDLSKPTTMTTDDASKNEKYRKFVTSRSHKSRSKNKKGEKRQCHLCGKRVIDLAVHIESHGGLQFQCEICDHRTTNRRQLKIHMNHHTKQREYPCRYCDKVFYIWSSRKSHEEQHIHKSFTCDQCGATYSNRTNLECHVKNVHLGRRHLKCKQCSFTTFIKCRLLNHVRSMHTSERPYQCTLCEHTANSNTGYYIHFKRHKKSGETTEYTLKCAYCGEVFTKDAALESHIVKAHSDVAVLV